MNTYITTPNGRTDRVIIRLMSHHAARCGQHSTIINIARAVSTTTGAVYVLAHELTYDASGAILVNRWRVIG